MATTTWRFTALQFLLAWESLGRDRLPFPLVFRGGAPLLADFQEERRQAATVVHDQMDDDLYRALQILAEPAARVEVCGHNGPARTHMLRVHAGVDNTAGVVASQLPGRTFDEGGDVILSIHSAANTAPRIAEVLPPVDAGRMRGVVVDKRDLGPSQGGSVLHEPSYVSAADEAKKFFDRPYSWYGEITVDKGPAFDGRKDDSGKTFQFVDYVNDGRYLVRKNQSVAAIPASAQTIASEIRLSLIHI